MDAKIVFVTKVRVPSFSECTFYVLNRLLQKSYDRNKHQNNLFHPKDSRISHEVVDFRHFFQFENILNFLNYQILLRLNTMSDNYLVIMNSSWSRNSTVKPEVYCSIDTNGQKNTNRVLKIN